MRGIKFRAWDKNTKEWYLDKKQGLVVGLYGDITNCWNGELMDDYTDRIILLQYTGLKDKNGVEIYEGDILETDKGYIQKVEHITETIDGTTYVSGFYAWDEEKHTWMAIDNTDKIIGNIYKNPELLEAKK